MTKRNICFVSFCSLYIHVFRIFDCIGFLSLSSWCFSRLSAVFYWNVYKKSHSSTLIPLSCNGLIAQSVETAWCCQFSLIELGVCLKVEVCSVVTCLWGDKKNNACEDHHPVLVTMLPPPLSLKTHTHTYTFPYQCAGLDTLSHHHTSSSYPILLYIRERRQIRRIK